MILFPEGARAVSAPGTAAVLEALEAALVADAVVWWQPPFDFKGDRPELVVVDPEVGIVALEVAETDVAVEPAADGYEYRGARRTAAPHARAVELANAVKARIAPSRPLDGLPNVVGALVAFPPGAAGAAATDARLRLEPADLADPARLRARLHDACGTAPDDALDLRPQMEALRAVLDPVSAVPVQRARRARRVQDGLPIPGALPPSVVHALDDAQEGTARSIGRRDIVLTGAAGTGKTVVLTARARLLADDGPVLLATHTKSLAAWLARRVPPSVHVEHVFGLLRRTMRDADVAWPGVDDDAALAAAARATREALGDGATYRHVLLDEAQDFAHPILAEVIALRRPGGTVMVAGDEEQSLYAPTLPRGAAAWRALGLDADAGGNYLVRLLRCYRNTAQILAFARDVAGYPRAVEAEAPRDGPVPTLVAAASPEEEARRVHEAVEHACVVGNPAAAGRVAVLLLSSRDDRRDERLRRAARIVDRLRTTRTVTWANDPDDEDARLRMATTDDEVVVASAHLAKGFDFPSVVVAGLGEPQRLHPRQRAALYVACTRAVDELQVVILKR